MLHQSQEDIENAFGNESEMDEERERMMRHERQEICLLAPESRNGKPQILADPKEAEHGISRPGCPITQGKGILMGQGRLQCKAFEAADVH